MPPKRTGIYPPDMRQPGMMEGLAPDTGYTVVPETIVSRDPPSNMFRDKSSLYPTYMDKGEGTRLWNPRPESSPSSSWTQTRPAQGDLRMHPQAPTATNIHRPAGVRDYGWAWSTPSQPLHYGRFLKWESDTLLKGLWHLENSALTNGVQKGLLAAGEDMERYAQANAPWTDESGEARSGLHYKIYPPDYEGRAARGRGTQIRMDLAYSVWYGIYLELPGVTKKRQSYAIVGPTLLMFSPLVKQYIQRALLKELFDMDWTAFSPQQDEALTRLIQSPMGSEVNDIYDDKRFNEYINESLIRRRSNLTERGVISSVLERDREEPMSIYGGTNPNRAFKSGRST